MAGFVKLRDVIDATALHGLALPVRRCPTNKTCFETKAAARVAALAVAHSTTMHAYRCTLCDQFHLGHRRGAVR